MNLYAVVDKKSCVAEYFISSCDEDAIRIWFCMLRGSVPMREFVDDFELRMICNLPDVCLSKEKKLVLDGIKFRRLIAERAEREELNKDAVES